MLTTEQKKINGPSFGKFSDDDSLSQLIVDVISAILDGNRTATSTAGNHRNRLTAVTAQREQEGVQLFIIGLDPLNDIFFSFFCGQ